MMYSAARNAGFSDREIAFMGVHEHSRLQVKMYVISHDNQMPSCEDTHQAISTWLLRKKRVPSLDGASLAFAINHRGQGMDYFVFCYWSNANECFLDLQVREQHDGARWRQAEDESFCVWDLEVIWHERNAFVEHILAPATPEPGRYLSDFLDR